MLKCLNITYEICHITTCPFDVKLCSLLDAFCTASQLHKGYRFLLLHLITFSLAFTNGNFLQIYSIVFEVWNFLTCPPCTRIQYTQIPNTMYSIPFHSWINIIVTQNYLCDFIYHSMFEPPERHQKEPEWTNKWVSDKKNPAK